MPARKPATRRACRCSAHPSSSSKHAPACGTGNPGLHEGLEHVVCRFVAAPSFRAPAAPHISLAAPASRPFLQPFSALLPSATSPGREPDSESRTCRGWGGAHDTRGQWAGAGSPASPSPRVSLTPRSGSSYRRARAAQSNNRQKQSCAEGERKESFQKKQLSTYKHKHVRSGRPCNKDHKAAKPSERACANRSLYHVILCRDLARALKRYN